VSEICENKQDTKSTKKYKLYQKKYFFDLLTSIWGIIKMQIGDFLKKKRQEKNISRDEMAKILNVSQSTISHWENNIRKPSIDMLQEISKHINIFPEIIDIFNGKEEKEIYATKKELEILYQKILNIEKILTETRL